MGEVISDIKFRELLEALSSKSVNKTGNGQIDIRGTVLSSTEFDRLYLSDIKDLFARYEIAITPDFAPSKQLYTDLDTFSNPALKNTSVPEITTAFRKKLSTAILDNYGKKLSGREVLEQANQGYVEPEEVITMLKYKSLYAQDEKAPDYAEPVSPEQLMEFYSPEKHPGRMLGLLKSGKIGAEFEEFHQEMLDGVSKKDRKEYIEDLTSEAKKEAATSQEFSTNLLGYANHQIIPDETLEQNISGDFLKQQYLDKKISIARVLAIYATAPKYFSAVESILTPDEITKAHSKDEVSDDALMQIPKDSRIAYLEKNNTKFSTMMYLFLHCDGFSVTELQTLLTAKQNTESLEFYIDAGSSPAKIKELYENYLIDYGCIKNLQAIGILTEKDMQKYHLSINKRAFYRELDNTQTVTIAGNGDSVPFSSTGVFLGSKAPKVFPSLEVYEILGKKNNKGFEQLPTINHTDEHQKTSFLDNYRIVALEFSNLVAFVPNELTKPIYIMPYQEAAYIIKNRRLPANFSEHEKIKEVRQTEKTNEDILRVANQFDEARPYFERIGYNEDRDFVSNYAAMLEEYQKIKIKGEN